MHHNAQHLHIKVHHRIFQGKRSFQSAEVPSKEIVSDFRYIGVNIAPSLPIAAVLAYQGMSILGLIFFITSAAYTIWVEIAHLSFHRPHESKIKKYRWFIKILELHRLHHTTFKYHFGIGSPWWDCILGTRLPTKITSKTG